MEGEREREMLDSQNYFIGLPGWNDMRPRVLKPFSLFLRFVAVDVKGGVKKKNNWMMLFIVAESKEEQAGSATEVWRLWQTIFSCSDEKRWLGLTGTYHMLS
jgi:hypothetical protein